MLSGAHNYVIDTFLLHDRFVSINASGGFSIQEMNAIAHHFS